MTRLRGPMVVHKDITQLFHGIDPLAMATNNPSRFWRLDVNRDCMGLDRCNCRHGADS